jgi:ParB-like chromosome segregation protein Spo0J
MGKMTHGKIRIEGAREGQTLVAIDQLKLNPKNPNRHSQVQIAVYAAILAHQGVRQPVRVSNRSGFVVKGHGQIEASKLNGWTHVPVEMQDYDSDAQEYADLVADNALGHQSELDLASINMDLPDFGPELEVAHLGIKDFTVDRSERGGREVSFTAGGKKHKCPNCQHEF